MKTSASSSKNAVICRSGIAVLCAVLLLFAIGCSRAPSFSILGSFFPSWILCGVLGIVLTVVVRVFFVRANFEQELSPLIVVYPCLALFFTFSIWLVFFK
jgi:YtcA family